MPTFLEWRKFFIEATADWTADRITTLISSLNSDNLTLIEAPNVNFGITI